MAEAEVNLVYRTAPVAVLDTVLTWTLPLGAVYLLWTGFALTLATLDSGAVQPGRAMLFMALQAGMWLFFVGLCFLARDKAVFLSRDGISLPFFLSPRRIPRTQHMWSDLTAIKYDSRGAKGRLILFFGGAKTVLDLAHFKPAEIEQLIVALDVWAEGADKFQALLEARTALDGGKTLTTSNSYTNMWEEELARRFGATNFIPLEPGQTLRDRTFTIVRQLAFGGASAIYLAHDNHNRKVVIKEAVVPADADEQLRQKSIEMLQRESQHLSALNHPALARMLDYFVEDERHYLVMEYLEGIDLRRLVREKGKPKVAEVLAWSEQIADIMRYLHAQNPPLIHRDLTPDNIILREDGSIAVIDFGASNHFVGTATQTLIGKQAYMPIEQLRGKTDHRSDIYSFGATLQFLLTGNDPEPLSVSHPNQENEEVPRVLDEIVAACTQLEPEARIQDMTALLNKLLELKANVV